MAMIVWRRTRSWPPRTVWAVRPAGELAGRQLPAERTDLEPKLAALLDRRDQAGVREVHRRRADEPGDE